MTYRIDIQNATGDSLLLTDATLTQLAKAVLRDHQKDAALTIRLVKIEEMIDLNYTYRKQNKPTNVLAFPSCLPEYIILEIPLLGDIIICPEVLLEECGRLKRSLEEYWSLMVIHGVLHLLGYDHIKKQDALVMQSLEIKLLQELGYSNPYELYELEVNDVE